MPAFEVTSPMRREPAPGPKAHHRRTKGEKANSGYQPCGSCHTLADAGTHGQTGPNLDDVLKGKDEAFIKQSIEDPNAVIAPGYQADIMPPDFAQTLTPAQIDALVKYLSDVSKGG